MKKKVYSLMFAACATFGFQSMAQEVRTSINVNFEDGQMIDGVDFKQGFGTVTFEVTENPVAFDGWDGGDAKADPLNFSEMCLSVERAEGGNVWDGPTVRLKGPNGEDGVLVDAQDPSTHFLHIQALLPEGTVAGKGTFVFNAYVQTIDGDNAVEPRLIADNAAIANLKWPSDYQAMTWHEFDVDLRPYLGNTVRKLQIQAERGGSMSWFIDNITVDNRRKDFVAYDFGQQVQLTEEADQMLIFYPGTRCCLTAQDQPAKGYAQTTFQEYDVDNSYQVWNVSVDPENSQDDGSALYTIEYDYSYLYNDGTIRATSESNNMRWFATKYTNRPKFKDPLLINAGTWKYLRPRFQVDGVETEATKDTTGWIFVKQSEVDAYLATVTKEVEKQVENGTYAIFFAGTNYCMTDQRLMEKIKNDAGTDSLYVPKNIYPLTLEEYDPHNTAIGQFWQIMYFSDLVDNETTRVFFDRTNTRNALRRISTKRIHWTENADSTWRAVGARMIMTEPFTVTWKDSLWQEHELDNYQNVFGDNATMINNDNSNVWFVKQVPMNKDGFSAIYRPNNGFQATALQARYAGGSLYATANANTTSDPNSAELKQYVWKMIPKGDPILATKESAKSLINKDTVFGYPTMVPAGNYRIVYRGTNQALAINSAATTVNKGLVVKTFDKADPDQIWTVSPVTAPKTGWDTYENQFYMNVGDYRIVNNPAQAQWVYLYTLEGAAANGMKEEESYFRALLMENPAIYGSEKAYILYANEKLKKFLRINVPVNNTGVAQFNGTGTITVNGRVWPEFNMVLQSVDADLPTVTREFANQLPLLEEGFYYVQYAYANDAEELAKPYVLSPASPVAEGAVTVLQEYDTENQNQQWYVAYSDTANVRKVAEGVEGAKIDTRYFLFASANVRDTLSKGATGKDLINMPSSGEKASFVINDWNKTAGGKNYDWFTYRFYEKEGKICLKESQHNQWMADHVALGAGAYALQGNPSASNNGTDNRGWDSKRIFVFKLVKAGDALAPVSELAPWHPQYGVVAVTLGDVNGDGKINVSDVVATVNAIIGNPAGEYNAKAADTNSDGKVNVSDVVSIVNMILNPDATTAPASLATETGALAIEGGKLMLTSSANIGGFDFAYEGDLSATEALKDFTVIPYVKDGQKRIIAYTMKRGVLTAGTSALFATSGTVTISDPLFVAENATELIMSDNVVTSEGTITTAACVITVANGVVSAQGATSIEIYAIGGNLVKSAQGASVAVSDLAAATYFVKAITAEGEEVVEKVILP